MAARWLQSSLPYLLPDRTATQRSGAVSLLVSTSIVAATIVLGGPLLRFDERARMGSTSGVQFEAAINWVFCHRYGGTTSSRAENRAVINLAEIRDPHLYSTSVASMLREAFGDARDYCQQPYDRPDLSEPTMMLIDAFALRVAPDASLRSLARSFAIARLVAIVLFGWCLLMTGFSVLFTVCTVSAAAYLTMLQGGHALYGNYPFVLPTVLLGLPIGRQVLVAPALWKKLAWLGVLGLWAGFLGNLRTSHFPLALALCLLIVFFDRDGDRTESRSRRTLRATSELAVFVLGLWTFHATYIKPLRESPTARSYHLIAHPLVLGLATIPNPIAVREGIRWDDSAGEALARKIDPTATYQSEHYEAALFTYYVKLWLYDPAGMVAIYKAKLLRTTDELFWFLSETTPVDPLFWPEKNGFWLKVMTWPVRGLSRMLTAGGVLFAMSLAGLVLRRWTSTAMAWTVCTIGALGTLSFLEAGIIMSAVVLWYSPVLVLSIVFAGLLPFELILLAAANRLEDGLPGRRLGHRVD